MVDRLRLELPHHLADMAVFSVATGLRQANVKGLEWQYVDLERKHATRVFTFRGEPINQVNTKAWTAALKRAGIDDFRWHDLRHRFATWHRQAGTPTHELQRLGGWKTGAMVERYAHVAPEALQSAASRLDAFGCCEMATPKQKGPTRWSQSLGKFGGPRQIRTVDQRIKSPLLYQLS